MDEAHEQEIASADDALQQRDGGDDQEEQHRQRRRDFGEVAGQMPRIVLSRLWVPRGNGGRDRVSAVKPMPVPAGLRHLVR